MLSVFWGKVKANLWCLLHSGHCVYVEAIKIEWRPEQVTFVGACTGSILDDSLVIHKGFYGTPRWYKLARPTWSTID